MRFLLEHPFAFDVADSGRVALLDRGGRRLCLLQHGADEAPFAHDLERAAFRVRFRDEDLVLLGRDAQLLRVGADGGVRGVARVRPGASDLAVLPSGSVAVSYDRDGIREHGVVLERLGGTPCALRDAGLLDATCLAVESGGLWVAGMADAEPVARAVRVRPVPAGLEVREVVALPAPPRSLAIGPDGALFVLLEPGESLVRVHAGEVGAARDLASPLHALARHGRLLLGCGSRGVEDLSGFVPPPESDCPAPDLPSCSP